jgi:hypothetical protein
VRTSRVEDDTAGGSSVFVRRRGTPQRRGGTEGRSTYRRPALGRIGLGPLAYPAWLVCEAASGGGSARCLI